MQEAYIARIVHYGQTPTAWQNQPGEPIIRLDAPTAWRMSSEVCPAGGRRMLLCRDGAHRMLGPTNVWCGGRAQVPQGKLGGEQDDVQDRREAAAVAIQVRRPCQNEHPAADTACVLSP